MLSSFYKAQGRQTKESKRVRNRERESECVYRNSASVISTKSSHDDDDDDDDEDDDEEASNTQR